MDFTSTLAAAMIFAGAALGLVSAAVAEMHCYSRALRDFRELSLETASSNISWFSECTALPQLPGTLRCLHGSEETLVLGEALNE